MKAKIWKRTLFASFLLLLGFLLILLLGNREENQIRMITQKRKLEEIPQDSWYYPEEKKEVVLDSKEEIPKIEEKKVGGYGVVGTLTIPKIELQKKILEKSDEKSLKLGIAKICGPEINREGNFCIVGHNYKSSFGKLKKLEIGDTFSLEDPLGRSTTYVIDSIEKVAPKNTECLTQNTKGEREATLITCTMRCYAKISNSWNRSL